MIVFQSISFRKINVFGHFSISSDTLTFSKLQLEELFI